MRLGVRVRVRVGVRVRVIRVRQDDHKPWQDEIKPNEQEKREPKPKNGQA